MNQLTLKPISIKLASVTLQGDLCIPSNAIGLVIFSHGSGSSRHSPRNKAVATTLQRAGIATLLMDLLTEEEENIDLTTRELRFNIPLLAERLIETSDWLSLLPETQHFQIGYFGSSTGAASALIAAAKRPQKTNAVVSRGGRVDLAGEYLARVNAPTLFIVGEYDDIVIQLNQEAFQLLPCEKKLEIIPKATHLFEEPGALETVAHLATNWFFHHFGI